MIRQPIQSRAFPRSFKPDVLCNNRTSLLAPMPAVVFNKTKQR
jgi:hypothetical protein